MTIKSLFMALALAALPSLCFATTYGTIHEQSRDPRERLLFEGRWNKRPGESAAQTARMNALTRGDKYRMARIVARRHKEDGVHPWSIKIYSFGATRNGVSAKAYWTGADGKRHSERVSIHVAP